MDNRLVHAMNERSRCLPGRFEFEDAANSAHNFFFLVLRSESLVHLQETLLNG